MVRLFDPPPFPHPDRVQNLDIQVKPERRLQDFSHFGYFWQVLTGYSIYMVWKAIQCYVNSRSKNFDSDWTIQLQNNVLWLKIQSLNFHTKCKGP